ncbi:hypothetical protein EIN_370380 [Entamoeba invadens IP1]|uniref:Uncharacterized protein n=1 Tax=Entamoeba invadens IP1 TaxID=370355 RepID=A0A0A1UBV1_ENTIV|nr:hypothetical protein EIN_370380 [Entamoeba invadens IP1]ELP92686.1 hypothetical protein EIN_370380 [Entamoeba invadens IP1]|eukprot:XP_004259457.1 hypothetical protein EIN_370380 [Entamoeba invadens IP1]
MDQKEQHHFRSRSKKALSTAMLVYNVLYIGGAITFTKTKQSNYALKVLIGKEVLIDNVIYNEESMSEISDSFCQKTRSIILEYKMNRVREIDIDKTCYTKALNKKAETKDATPKTLITICRNREAAFSNFLAHILIEHNFVLHITIKTIKDSTNVQPFYVWDVVTDSFGKSVSLENDENIFSSMVQKIISKVHSKRRLTANDIFGPLTPSAFVPSDTSTFEVIVDSRGNHDFNTPFL